MPSIHLIRHAQASFGAADYDALSDLGRRQARALGGELRRRGLRPRRVVSGTLRRQRDTAALSADAGAELELDARFNEYDHLELLRRHAPAPGDAQGSSRALQVQLDAALRRWIAGEPSQQAAGGATAAAPLPPWTQFSAAAIAALDDVLRGLEAGQAALVFTSGGVIAAICGRLLGTSAEGVVALNRVTVNGGITKLVRGASGTSLSSFNEHVHFEDGDRSLLTYR